MAIYEYLCPDCGPFDVFLPMGTAPETRDCSACEGPARRRFSGPHLRRVHPVLAASLAREERSREAPEVVPAPGGTSGSAPGGVPRRRASGRPARPPHPALARLPRP
ncbi:zinc ribbon domain-containing protein [Microtetraspora sp. AC03309]|uniref:FmdB family zinc ribbon protein n=1 Tax=Microtetraspora sp. AC03309 TaxID=2779376 RepID=UPI001E375028|nr:zinc ribbon domain-containing protein [Microtetraspora sp. AC03309]MCC5581635.1 zinc ribbon domain-containing protein [Microtetraspora sp. AC03309]